MDIRSLYDIFRQHPTVTTDSRNCPPNSIFFALKGDTFDGNMFADKALEQGSAFAVVDEPQYAPQGDNRYILVDNCLLTLQQLATFHRRALGTPVVGITGTNGKTTTKELTAAVLQRKYRVLYTQGNLNNSIGVPLTLLRLTKDHQVAIIEMGASHPGDIKELVNIAQPNYGLITNVGKAHLLGFGDFDGVIRTKGELYDYLREHEGQAFINNDNPHLLGIAHGLTLSRYGIHPSSAPLLVQGESLGANPLLRLRWNGHEVQTHLIGAYNLENVLAAATVGLTLGVEPADISAALESYIPSNNRSQYQETASNHLIIDAYNANPTSMQAAIQNFQQMDAPHKMCILGDMRELGINSLEEHMRIVQQLEAANFEQVWLVGEEFAKIGTGSAPSTSLPSEGSTTTLFRHFHDVDEVKAAIADHKPQGMTILIKGSNGIHLFRLPELL